VTIRPKPFAAVVVAVVGLVALGGCTPGGGLAPSQSNASPPDASSNAGSAASPFACGGETTGCAGPLAPGEHSATNFLLGLTLVTPEGWVNVRDIRRTYGLEQTSGLGAEIEVMGLNAIAEQTEACGPLAKPGVGSTVEDFIAAVQTHPGLVGAAPVPAELDGFRGQAIDFTVASTWGTMCPDDSINPTVLMLTDTGDPPGRAIGYHSDQRVRWIVVDVRGEAIIVELVGPVAESSFSSSVAAAQPIVDSLRFGEAR